LRRTLVVGLTCVVVILMTGAGMAVRPQNPAHIMEVKDKTLRASYVGAADVCYQAGFFQPAGERYVSGFGMLRSLKLVRDIEDDLDHEEIMFHLAYQKATQLTDQLALGINLSYKNRWLDQRQLSSLWGIDVGGTLAVEPDAALGITIENIVVFGEVSQRPLLVGVEWTQLLSERVYVTLGVTDLLNRQKEKNLWGELEWSLAPSLKLRTGGMHGLIIPRNGYDVSLLADLGKWDLGLGYIHDGKEAGLMVEFGMPF
jgi:hypothetical protein